MNTVRVALFKATGARFLVPRKVLNADAVAPTDVDVPTGADAVAVSRAEPLMQAAPPMGGVHECS